MDSLHDLARDLRALPRHTGCDPLASRISLRAGKDEEGSSDCGWQSDEEEEEEDDDEEHKTGVSLRHVRMCGVKAGEGDSAAVADTSVEEELRDVEWRWDKLK